MYLNQKHVVVEKTMKFGNVAGISVGEFGRGRREVFLPTPKGVEDALNGLREDLTIGLSKSGRPRIDRKEDGELYLILSSERGYTRRGDGYIRVPKDQKVEIVARGNGADGDAGRIGTWDAVIFKAHSGDIFRVTWGGYGYGYSSTFYVVADGKVFVADQPEVEDLYESLGIEVPFTLKYNEEDGLVIVTDEWVAV